VTDRPGSERAARLADVQAALRDAGLDGWLFAVFRGSDPIAPAVLRLPDGHETRRWYYYVPAAGAPRKLVHAVEARRLEALPGDTTSYVGWQALHERLREILGGARRVAMQYSPLNAIPYVSRVDAGTVELVRTFGVEVVSSADLVQRFEAVWTPAQAASHLAAAAGCRATIDAAYARVRRALAERRRLDEHGLQQFILEEFARLGLETDDPPIVAVNANSADPHYTPPPRGSSEIREGDVLELDIWARQAGVQGSVYADITWTAVVAREPAPEHLAVFDVVRRARDEAIALVTERVAAGRAVHGYEVDDAARAVVRAAGHAERFVHRTGHSIGHLVHGNGANVDNLETRDERRLLPGTGFSIEPGIYLEGRFGVRSEVDLYIEPGDGARGPRAVVTGQPIQTAVVALLA
jgi:Xaa-Pro aminopeptidase